ncbi:Peptidoglycan/LPS O-acetylase OafA/YrhL, contains acyltransferase and SGNH-hydrolase domains [Colwellia chukchiensis]|uniref:Peptidoglycan/LPS O-acetylase OafA/YrhL, contains acyltransferase and SGNH-hydrolase domains n=1 Tax=Colwellia chukchiensis TaxID=641665 RepID=A0A1H7H8A9_9GAMM|nr:acyltransferase family protein [Colwellia chukchiensis]SEK46524.1 Peptidoglycan/LPS O-acetylase OafA/YrhL, contains acyltransferase and SGNH-hydrolase domains [Colwellia chukchiensis]
MSTIKYRPEIDGLRALAVVSVLIYHVNVAWMPGGFVGVDIFFVISGFLITKIIYQEMQSRSFSFSIFYQRRIKRIIPVFVAVILVTLLVGYFIQLPFDFKGLGNSSLAATVFLANVRYALVGNYFQADNVKPLLHTWSLSVEEQFYFIWPIVLIFALRLFSSEYRLRLFVLVLMLSSFVLATWMASEQKWATYAYFLLPTRAGELLLGAYLAMLPANQISSHQNKEYLSFIGLLLIFLSFIYIDQSIIFPGLSAFIPCLGAGLIILAGSGTRVGLWLSFKPIVFIGLISYSLYMWHWPILTFARYIMEVNNFELLIGGALISVIVFISWLSWLYIEKPFRRLKISTKKTIVFVYGLPSATIVFISLMIFKNGGYPERFDMPLSYSRVETIGCHNSLSAETCFINKTDSNDISLLIGDSHAGHFSHFFKQASLSTGWSIKDASAGSCKFYSTAFVSNRCETVKEKIISELVGVKNVFIANRFDTLVRDDNFRAEYKSYIEALVEKGINVYVLLQVPKFIEKYPLKQVAYERRYGVTSDLTSTVDIKYQVANKVVTDLLVALDGVTIIDFTPLTCPKGQCSQFVNGEPIYFDDDHLNAFGSQWLANEVFSKGGLLKYAVKAS